MSSQPGLVGSLFITLAASLCVGLAACTSSEPFNRPLSTGSAGNTGVGIGAGGITGGGGGVPLPPAVDAGAAVPGGPTTCVNGMAVSPPRPQSRGPPGHAPNPAPPA